MSVIIRPYRRGGWEVDIRVLMPDGTEKRERRRAPIRSKSGALRWGRAREQELLFRRLAKPRKEVPTLSEFAGRFLEGYVRANRQKPSGIATKESILRIHLVPFLGRKRLDRIKSEDVQRLKSRLGNKATKTVNNVLTVLNKLLKVAVEWEVIEQMPCTIKLLPVVQPEMEFHDFDEYEALVEAAGFVDDRARLIVLLGGEAGLRRGEMLALEWTDVDFKKDQLTVRHSDWHGHLTSPKNGRIRRIPLTKRLSSSLRGSRHLRGERVLCESDGQPLTHNVANNLVRRAARLANLRNGGIHILRHTFCSHLAMRGAPARAIQELAGHADLTTTQRYMHLSPQAINDAIQLLEKSEPAQVFGDILETGRGTSGTGVRSRS